MMREVLKGIGVFLVAAATFGPPAAGFEECEFFDCNENGIDDRCDINCVASTCQNPEKVLDICRNFFPFECEVSPDLNADNVPDECQCPTPGGCPTFMMVAGAKNDVRINPPSPTVQAQPGDELTVEIYGKCWSHGVPHSFDSIDTLKGYQAQLDYSSFFNDPISPGNVLPLDFAKLTDPEGRCPGSIMGTNPIVNESAFIDIAHDPDGDDGPLRIDYVFTMLPGFPAVNTLRCDYRFSAGTTAVAGTPFHRCDLGMTPRYFGTVKLKVSDDAAGQFVVCLDGSDITHMQGPPYGPDFSYMVPDGAPIAARIIPMKFECLTINLAPPKFCDVTEWVPATGTIDGRQISNPDGTNPAGFNSVDLTLVFGGDCTSEDVTPAAFTVTTLPAGTAPSVTSVTLVSGTTYRANLSTTIPANKWTKICFDPSPDEDCVCIGSLPGDVQGNRAVNATADAERLRQCLDTQTCAEHQGDLNRSGAINPRDLIRLMDILNGAGNFDPNNLQTLPLSPC